MSAGPYLLFGCPGTASFAPCAVLEEAGLAYRHETVDIAAGAHRDAAFLAINPAGKIPALQVPDGPVLTESAAICLFLADRHRVSEIAPGLDEPERGPFLSLLVYLTTTVQETYKRIHYPERFAAPGADPEAIRLAALVALFEQWELVEADIERSGPYALGRRYSLLDIYIVMLTGWLVPNDTLLDRFPALRACRDLVARRPAIARCIERYGALTIGR